MKNKKMKTFITIMLSVPIGAQLANAQRCSTCPSESSTYSSGYSSPGAFPSYQYPSVMPGIEGPSMYMMPDGGTWTVYPNVLPGCAPPPVYTPPEYPAEVNVYHHYPRHRPRY
jgi:hypothetical protein